MIKKVLSGGQTGVDRAALDAALEAGIPCGGYVPKGRLAEDGRVPGKYPMQECDSEDYAVRTFLNVRHSDATLILARGKPGGGTLFTKRVCLDLGKPVRVIDLEECGPRQALERASDFLRRERPSILNVAGPRESGSPGIYVLSFSLLREVFISMKEKIL